MINAGMSAHQFVRNTPTAVPSLHSGRLMSDIVAPSEAASMSLLAIQTEAHAYSMLTKTP